MRKFLNKVVWLLGNRRFFQFVVILFIVESAWIALSAVYPMAFDEDFHFGLIKVYSHYWLPFLSSQPSHTNAFGAVARDPSYLYHYLMSFPYRFIALFVHSQTPQVIILRFINIGLFASGLVLFKKVFAKVGLSNALSNIILLLFILIPISPLLAAQINYDNMLFPVIGLVCLLTFKVTDQVLKNKISLSSIVLLLSTCLLGSLVKYAFLPIFLGVVLYLFILIFMHYKKDFKKLLNQLWQSWQNQALFKKIFISCLLIISLGMFIQRDGVNLVKYHTISPDCASVLSVDNCSAYSAWEYNYVNHKTVIKDKATIKYYNPVTYVGEWLYWMWYRLFFAINGPASDFTNYPPLPLPSAMAAVLEIGAFVAIIRWRKHIFANNPYIFFLFLVSILYLIALLGQGYATYRYTDILENMNGRYLIPILLMLAAVAGKAFSYSLKNSHGRKVVISLLAVIFFFQGGGVLTFISRSDSTWFWPNSAVQRVNSTAHNITSPVIIDGKKTYSTNYWFFN